jgi:hypothetical protein
MPTALNRNQRRRDEVLKPFFEIDRELEASNDREPEYDGGVESYCGLPLRVMDQLVEEGFVDLDERQNNSPTIREFMEFARRFPDEITFHGYAVTAARKDYRLSVEGVDFVGTKMSAELRAAWRWLGRNADARDESHLWWD